MTESLHRARQRARRPTRNARTNALDDCPPHEMSYLTSKRLQYGGSRAQESRRRASTHSCPDVDELGTNRVRRAHFRVDSGARANKMPIVPPGEAAHFVWPRGIAAAQRPRASTVTSHLLPTYARVHLAFERGEGVWLVGTDGERYLDFTSGVAVNALGHAHPHLVAALDRAGAEALARLQSLRDSRSRARRAAAVRRELRRRGVLLQFRRRGDGMRDQDGAQIPFGERRAGALPHHHLRGRVPRPHAGDARRRRTEEISRRLRPRGRGLRSGAVRRSRGDQARDRAARPRRS